MDYQTDRRMRLKREAIPLPDLEGKSVLDVGCDHGYWCKLASDAGAFSVLGLDRNRPVKGLGVVDLIERNCAQGWRNCDFVRVDLGKQWTRFGSFDVVLCLSMYHHAWANCGSHSLVWEWLRDHTADTGVLLWEGPLNERDPVARSCAARTKLPYREVDILAAAETFFTVERIGPALHEPHRVVLRCHPKEWK